MFSLRFWRKKALDPSVTYIPLSPDEGITVPNDKWTRQALANAAFDRDREARKLIAEENKELDIEERCGPWGMPPVETGDHILAKEGWSPAWLFAEAVPLYKAPPQYRYPLR